MTESERRSRGRWLGQDHDLFPPEFKDWLIRLMEDRNPRLSSRGQEFELELAYTEFTAPVSVLATTEAGATAIVAAPSFTADGRPILVEFFAPKITRGTTNIAIVLKEDGTAIATLTQSGVQNESPGVLARRFSPTAGAHTYSIAAYVDAGIGGSVTAGAGGAGTIAPGFIRITRATGTVSRK